MGWDIILAAVLASMLTRSWEHSRRRAAARWEQARRDAHDRAEQRRRDRGDRTRRRHERLEEARRFGPSDPLWWALAAGWLVAAAARAAAAAVAGAREGAAVGARDGYRIGRERADARRESRRARRDPPGEPHPRRRERQAPPDADPDPEPVATVACVDCGVYVAENAADDAGRCRRCATTNGATGAAPDDHTDVRDIDPGDGDHDVTDAEVVDPASPHQKGDPIVSEQAGQHSTAISMNGATLSGGDGEGYATTLNLLGQVGQLLTHVDQVMNDLGDTIASKHVDVPTVQGVSDIEDQLQAAANRCGELTKHVESKHQEVAAAVTGAGGSSEVADTDWYDTY